MRTMILTILLLVVIGSPLWYIFTYIIAVVHEFGHYHFRRKYAVPTDVFIGRGSLRLNIGNWWFGLLPLKFCNYPASFLSLKTDRRFKTVIIAGIRVSLIVGAIGIFVSIALFLFHVEYILAGLLLILSASMIVGNVPNGLPSYQIYVNGKVKHKNGLPTLGDPVVGLSDGAWFKVWDKCILDHALVDELSAKLQVPTVRSTQEMKYLIERKAVRGAKLGLYHIPSQLSV
ncbi:hypothetical protein [Alicyclobacillus ferrooxydans]|uniref:Uncharacterized protein n=1 Tax=Alicyclobacillus ferrooxydans TaxID=471514 RepID=A0A0N8PNW6_9BACL|nr:hypothetical protein [Alicyclobacillus ferrooxydans]KPV42669.1 hypothetical protein AN477_16180 [Alicyclobacillus ferrooxydans]